jgi:hypothetical protein
MPRSVKARAISRSVLPYIWSRTGRFGSGGGIVDTELAVAELDAAGLGRLQGELGALGDQPALFLGQRGVNVQHKRVHVRAQLGDDERHLLSRGR